MFSTSLIEGFDAMKTTGKDLDRGRITTRLHDLVSHMPTHAAEALLTRLEEKFRVNRRKSPRKPYLKEVDFATADRAYKEFIKDISAGGLFIETRSALAVGQEITLVLSLPGHERPIKVMGDVVRATQQGIGVRFKPASPIIQEIIETLVEKI